MNWTFTDATNRVVSNGAGISQLASNPEIVAWVAAGNVISPYVALVQTSDQARALGEAYVEEFFTLMQMMELMELMQSSSTPADQLAKIQAVYTWLTTIKAAWLANPSTFNPTTFGNPPYTYGDIASTTH